MAPISSTRENRYYQRDIDPARRRFMSRALTTGWSISFVCEVHCAVLSPKAGKNVDMDEQLRERAQVSLRRQVNQNHRLTSVKSVVCNGHWSSATALSSQSDRSLSSACLPETHVIRERKLVLSVSQYSAAVVSI